ncbi:MAG TPA: NADH-quinone oxidoreductase subunit J [Thermoplasmata archaeon]|nr:NADH-quinone oxidoreductase subunit J [Thermoplasmata archaeon]
MTVDGELVAFLVLSAIEVLAALMVVVSKKLVHSVFWLFITLLTIGAIYLLFRTEFIAFIQIIVYAGAVPVLMLFGIMLTRRKIMEEPHEPE